ncbi:MAG: hypothetical protein U0869_16015 [Chloroflexota bacterium]
METTPAATIDGTGEAPGPGAAARPGLPRDATRPPAREWPWLAAILLAALAIRLLVVLWSPSLVHPDEIFQVLEQAHRLAFGYGSIPWEFQAGVRSWILPGVLALPMWLAGRVSDDPAVIVGAVGLTLAIASLLIVVAAWVAARRIGLAHAILAAGAAALWFTLVNGSGRTLNEVIATVPLVLALTVAGRPEPRRRDALAAGLLAGIVVVLRLQLAPASLVIAAVVLWRGRRRAIVPLLAGLAVPLLVAGAVDGLTWGRPFSSIVDYVRVNVLEGKASSFGVSPVWAYAQMIWQQWRVGTLVIAALALLGSRRLPAWFLVAATILVTHSLIGHKEARFIFPALAIVVVLAGVGSAEVLRWVEPRVRSVRVRRALLPAFLAAWAVASLVFALGPTTRYEWTNGRAALLADHWVHDQGDVCGVGLRGLLWVDTGGYAHLHRPIPVHLADGPDAPFTAVDTLLVRTGPEATPPAPYVREACFRDGFQEICAWRRPGGCTPAPGGPGFATQGIPIVPG